MPQPRQPSATERIAALEARAAAQDALLQEIRGDVKSINQRLTTSRGMVIGAVSVLGAVGGTIAFLWNAFLDAMLNLRT